MLYKHASEGKHSLSAQSIRSVLVGKTVSDILTVGKNLLLFFFRESYGLPTLLGILFLVFLVGKTVKDSSKWNTRQIIKEFVLTICVYMIFVFIVYTFSMPLSEAKPLFGASRYICMISIYLLGILAVKLVSVPPVILPSKLFLLFMLGILSVTHFGIRPFTDFLLIGERAPSFVEVYRINQEVRARVTSLISNYEIPSECSYLTVIGNGDQGGWRIGIYLNYFLSYSDLKIMSVQAFNDDKNDLWRNYEYLIAYTDDPSVRETFKERFGSDEQVIYLNGFR